MSGRHATGTRRAGAARRRPRARLALAGVAAGLAAALAAVLLTRPAHEAGQGSALPTSPGSYLGVYIDGVPHSFAVVDDFASDTGVRPNVAVYYSGWEERFRTAFAKQATDHGVVPLVQIDPTKVRLSAIAAGQYDSYLLSFAASIRAFRHQVILSFGHEMNGWWYSWGHGHASPADFVAAWRHIFTVFRAERTSNVTWLWTINIVGGSRRIPDPGPWWPGSPYVTWIGIDGYYHKRSWTFASLFGPTIKAVHMLARRPIPILIAETGAAPQTGQPDKIADLFEGIRSYGLLGFVWFDAKRWRLHSKAAVDTFRREAQAHRVVPILTAMLRS